jgi:asparagine synthase (glutamine-hydrolysing)
MLDHRVFEVGLGLPEAFTLGHGGKRVLRALYARRFGRQLAQRRKIGFGVPVEKWLRTSLAPVCDRLFDRRRLDATGVLSSAALGDGSWRRWVDSVPQVLWHALALAVWTEANLGGGETAVRELFDSAPMARAG